MLNIIALDDICIVSVQNSAHDMECANAKWTCQYLVSLDSDVNSLSALTELASRLGTL